MTSIIDLLRQRAARGSRVPHGDGASIALCVEGGAMRGVVSAGMVGALEELGLTTAFDAVYGSSAGALNAAYFLAGQARLGTTIYFEDINTPAFISRWRALRGRPIVNLGYLLDDVVIRRKPLDVARVLASPTPLTVLATDVTGGCAATFSGFQTPEELLNAVRAGATMPIMAGGPCIRDGRPYFDASLSEPIPVPSAEAAGHTHLLVLLTRPRAGQPKVSAFDRWFIAPRLRRISPLLSDNYLSRGSPYSELLARIDIAAGTERGARVVAIRPAAPAVGKLERKRDVLAAAAERGRRAVLEIFAASGFTPAS